MTSLHQWIFGEEREGLIFGLDGCGKTTLLYRWKLGQTVETIPTIGFNLETISHGRKWNLTLWDMGGGEKVRPMFRLYLGRDRFVLFVHDCVDEDRLEEQLEEFHECAKKLHERGGRHMWVIFNKQDALLPEKRDSIVQNLMSRYEVAADRYADSVVVKVLDLPGLSAKQGVQIHAVLDDIKRTLQNHKPAAKAIPGGDMLDPDAPVRWKMVEKVEEMAKADSTTADGFYQLLERGQLPDLGIYTYLKAAYYVLVDGCARGSSIPDIAEALTTRLERSQALLGAGDNQSPPVPHRTMAVFWLVHLQIAAVNYGNARSLGTLPSRDDFKDVLMLNPELVDPFLWKDYYSTDRIFTTDARERWCTPDLRPLPSVISGSKSYIRSQRLGHGESDRLIRFAMAVVQHSLKSNLMRGAVVKQALEVLRSSIIRQRVLEPSLPPYSETKAYFWIQLVHAALSSLKSQQASEKPIATDWKVMVQILTPPVLKALFGITGETWREYYSEGLWDSVGARMEFKTPDLKALPATFPLPTLANIQKASRKLAQTFGLADKERQPPSEEDLSLMSAVVIDEAEFVELEGPDGKIIRSDSHSRRLLSLHQEIARGTGQHAVRDGDESDLALRIKAVVEDLPVEDAASLPQRAFWAQQLATAMEESPSASFEELISARPYLACEDMPLVHFWSLLAVNDRR